MNLCLACYENRLASLLENATCFQLFTFDENELKQSGGFELAQRDTTNLVSALESCGVDVLICGGVTGCTRRLIQQAGIELHPWVRGTQVEVLQAFQSKTLDALAMPGCGGHRCGRGRMSSDIIAPGCGHRNQGRYCGNESGRGLQTGKTPKKGGSS